MTSRKIAPFLPALTTARGVIATALLVLLASITSPAQSPSVFTTGLQAPLKLSVIGQGKLLVAEAGNGPNTGRVSLLDRCVNRVTLLDGLPAGFAPPGGDPDGPTAVALLGRTLYVTIGEGNTLVAGPVAGTTVPNPNPSSPLFSTVLAIEFSAATESSAGGFNLTAAAHLTIKNGTPVTLTNGRGETATIRLLADFPDTTPNPLPFFAGNVRASHPFGIELDGAGLFVADAALNAIFRVDRTSGAIATVVAFPPLANPTPIGPPVIDTVPDGIRRFGDQLLITLLTGFPFPVGGAQVRRVDPTTGSFAPFITGLTMAIDVLPVTTPNGANQFYVLEHSLTPLAQPRGPGRLTRYDTPAGPPLVLAANLSGPVGMARDAQTGDIFITENVTGRIIRVLGNELDVFIQDDDNGDTLRFNSLTGAYLFTSCRGGGVTLAGQGTLTRVGCQIALRDPYVTATLDRCLIAPSNRAKATVRLGLFGPTFRIADSN